MCVRPHLGQVLPQLTQAVEHLSVDLRVLDGVDVAQDAQHPPPHHCGHVGVPAGPRAARHHAAVLARELAGLCVVVRDTPGHSDQPVRPDFILFYYNQIFTKIAKIDDLPAMSW